MRLFRLLATCLITSGCTNAPEPMHAALPSLDLCAAYRQDLMEVWNEQVVPVINAKLTENYRIHLSPPFEYTTGNLHARLTDINITPPEVYGLEFPLDNNCNPKTLELLALHGRFSTDVLAWYYVPLLGDIDVHPHAEAVLSANVTIRPQFSLATATLSVKDVSTNVTGKIFVTGCGAFGWCSQIVEDLLAYNRYGKDIYNAAGAEIKNLLSNVTCSIDPGGNAGCEFSPSLTPADFCASYAKLFPAAANFDQNRCVSALYVDPNPCTGSELHDLSNYATCSRNARNAARSSGKTATQADLDKACGKNPAGVACNNAVNSLGSVP
jgi:hypothetical protein